MRLPQMGDERMFRLIPDNVSSLFVCPTPTRATPTASSHDRAVFVAFVVT
jgi:hypothetical protein